MASTPVEIHLELDGVTSPKLLLYTPGGSDTEANSSGGDVVTKTTQGVGSWVATVTEALVGLYKAEVVSGSTLLGSGWIYLNDTTDRHYVEETRLARWS